MSDEKPNPFEDVRKGLGLLFRAARTTVGKLPTKDLEEVVVTSAREVGRAFESVGRRIESEVLGRRTDGSSRPTTGEGPSPGSSADGEGKKAGTDDDDKPSGPTPPDAA